MAVLARVANALVESRVDADQRNRLDSGFTCDDGIPSASCVSAPGCGVSPHGRWSNTKAGSLLMPEFGAWAHRWWMPVLFIVVAGHITNVCVMLFLHRAQTHRGVRLHALAATPMRLWLWLTTAIVTKEWVACHRKHHAFADREGDPHSPVVEGLREIMLKGAFYYRKAVKQPGMLEKYGKGTPNDWLERYLLTPFSSMGV